MAIYMFAALTDLIRGTFTEERKLEMFVGNIEIPVRSVLIKFRIFFLLNFVN